MRGPVERIAIIYSSSRDIFVTLHFISDPLCREISFHFPFAKMHLFRTRKIFTLFVSAGVKIIIIMADLKDFDTIIDNPVKYRESSADLIKNISMCFSNR